MLCFCFQVVLRVLSTEINIQVYKHLFFFTYFVYKNYDLHVVSQKTVVLATKHYMFYNVSFEK